MLGACVVRSATKKVKKKLRFVGGNSNKAYICTPNHSDELNFKQHKDMTKADIVSEIAKSTGVEKVQVQAIVEAFMESIKTSLTEKNNVYLRGFGSFIVKKRAKKVARNISKNTTITIPEHNIPAFKPAKSFAAKVK